MKKPIVIQIRHYGVPFIDSDCAKLLCTGILHHYIVLIP